MRPLQISANALGLALGIPATRLLGILAGERPVTANIALRLARYFGTSAELWMNLQQAHDLSEAKAISGAIIAAEVRPRALA